MNTVLILGANGRFGQAATQAFADAGWRVLAQVRRAPAAPLPGRSQSLAVPMADLAALAAQARGASVVVYAVSPPYTRWQAEALPLLHQGLAVAQALGARFMLPGNVYNYGTDMPALLQETTPQRPSTPKGHIRCAMEAQLLAHTQASGLSAVVLRAGDFYGCGSGSWLDLVIAKSIAQGKLTYPGPLDVSHAWAYLPDLARAFVAVATLQGRPLFETFHFAGHALTGHEFMQALEAAGAALGQRPAGAFTRTRMPWGLIRAGGLVYPMWRELWRMSYLWRVAHALDGHALQQAVGLLPGTPVQRALSDALRALAPGRAAVAAAA